MEVISCVLYPLPAWSVEPGNTIVSGNLLTKLLPLTGILTFIGSSLKFHIPAKEIGASVRFTFCTGCALVNQQLVINSISKRCLNILICIFYFIQSGIYYSISPVSV